MTCLFIYSVVAEYLASSHASHPRIISVEPDKRNDSSHEGKQAIPFSHDIRLYFWTVEANELLSHSMQSNPIYERNSFEYSNQINLAKEETLKEIGVIRYNTFAITKCILCSLSERIIENVKQLLPDLDKIVMESLAKAE